MTTWNDLITQVIVLNLLPAPAIPEGDGDGLFGLFLSDDIFIQFLDDFLRGQLDPR